MTRLTFKIKNLQEGLLSSLDELKRSQNELAWVERLDITTDVTPFMQTDLDENGGFFYSIISAT